MAIPFTTIILDKPRRLRFGMAAMVEFEQVTGLQLKDLDDDLSMDVASKVLWCMLRQDDAELTLAETMRLVDEHAPSLTAVMNAVAVAIREAFISGDAPNAQTPPVTGRAGKKPEARSTSPRSTN